MATIAIIGAGLAGLTVARELAAAHSVTVFEKGRGVGGRMSSRYSDPFFFDHGAQFFTARSRGFKDWLKPMLEAGTIAPWHARFAELTGSTITSRRQWDDDYAHYVGVPNMNALQKSLAAGLNVETGKRVTRCNRTDKGWLLHFEDDSAHSADWLIITAPLPQASELAGAHAELGWSLPMKACYALMLGFEEAFEMEFDAARVLEADISWISRNVSKPGRNDAMTIVVHATNAWADKNVDLDIETVQKHLASELKRTAGIDANNADYIATHRWRYANIDKQDAMPCFFDEATTLGIAGDWFIRGRVESAFKSAMALVENMHKSL